MLTKAKNLTRLDISNDRITSLEPLRELPAISDLQLNDVPPVDLSPLAALTRLVFVSLEGQDLGKLETPAPAEHLDTIRFFG